MLRDMQMSYKQQFFNPLCRTRNERKSKIYQKIEKWRLGEPGACGSSGDVDYKGDTNEGCPDKFFSEFLNKVLFRSEREHNVFEIFTTTVFISMS